MCAIVVFFFFKQKTAYEMRISDWSSDVCSSDLDVGEQPAIGLAWPFAQRIAGKHHLGHDLARSQVADQLHRAGVAEAAVERAADLARHAQRPPIGVGDEHHFIILPVRRTEQPFARAVGGNLGSEEHTSELQSLMRISYAVFCLKK